MSTVVDTCPSVNYSRHMIEIRQTDDFVSWFKGLKDANAKARIVQRLIRLEDGNFGDVKHFHGIGEMRIDYGPGYRVYFVQKGAVLVILLCGGDKRRQARDIERARQLAQEVET